MEQGEEETRALKGTYNDSQSSLEAYASMMQMREEDAAQEMAWALSQSGTLRDEANTEFSALTASFQGDDNGI